MRSGIGAVTSFASGVVLPASGAGRGGFGYVLVRPGPFGPDAFVTKMSLRLPRRHENPGCSTGFPPKDPCKSREGGIRTPVPVARLPGRGAQQGHDLA
jgi:hypothetical protein